MQVYIKKYFKILFNLREKSFYTVYSLIAVARASKTMLNTSGKRRHHCLVPNLEEVLSFFTVEYDAGCRMVILFSSVAQSCLTFCNPMDCSMPGFPELHQLPELDQTHIH